MRRSDSSTAILRVLRRTRDEAQLTQLLAAVAGDDEELAGELAGILVSAAPNKPQCEELGEVPPRLHLRAEATLRSVKGPRRGRVDLRFDDAARQFTLLAELKLHSPYAPGQVDAYREALAELPHERRAALLAVTRNVPGAGEPGHEERGWLGSLRWIDIYNDLLGLRIKDAELANQWRLLLQVIYEQGDFGVKQLDPVDVRGWSAYLRTREQLERLIDDLAPTALEHLQELLRAREAWAGVSDAETAVLHTRGVERKVPYPTQTTVQMRFCIPAADAHERLRIQFLGGFDEPYFTVEARRAGAPALLAGRAREHRKFTAAVDWLTRKHEFKTDERVYVAHVHGPREWLHRDDEKPVGEALLEIVKTDLELLVQSGILDRDAGFDADRGQVTEDERPADEQGANSPLHG